MLDQFSRSRILLGTEAMDKLAASRVIIFGVGGVGSYVAEGLVRCGVAILMYMLVIFLMRNSMQVSRYYAVCFFIYIKTR